MLFGAKFGHWNKLFTLLDFGSFLKNSGIVIRSLSHPVGVFSMLPKRPKCHMRQNYEKSQFVNNQIKNLLELSLATLGRGPKVLIAT
jgi:hypothetical protein